MFNSFFNNMSRKYITSVALATICLFGCGKSATEIANYTTQEGYSVQIFKNYYGSDRVILKDQNCKVIARINSKRDSFEVICNKKPSTLRKKTLEDLTSLYSTIQKEGVQYTER